MSPEESRDLDETRRLLYMALAAGKTEKYNLAGTLINALRHHQGVTDADLEEKVIAQVEGAADEAWARGQVDRITGQLGQGSGGGEDEGDVVVYRYALRSPADGGPEVPQEIKDQYRLAQEKAQQADG